MEYDACRWHSHYGLRSRTSARPRIKMAAPLAMPPGRILQSRWHWKVQHLRVVKANKMVSSVSVVLSPVPTTAPPCRRRAYDPVLSPAVESAARIAARDKSCRAHHHRRQLGCDQERLCADPATAGERGPDGGALKTRPLLGNMLFASAMCPSACARFSLPGCGACPAHRVHARCFRAPPTFKSYQTYRDARTTKIRAITVNKLNCAHKLLAKPWPLLSPCIVMGDLRSRTPSLSVASNNVGLLGNEALI
jgi:hypothetical protein